MVYFPVSIPGAMYHAADVCGEWIRVGASVLRHVDRGGEGHPEATSVRPSGVVAVLVGATYAIIHALRGQGGVGHSVASWRVQV